MGLLLHSWKARAADRGVLGRGGRWGWASVRSFCIVPGRPWVYPSAAADDSQKPRATVLAVAVPAHTSVAPDSVCALSTRTTLLVYLNSYGYRSTADVLSADLT